MDSRLQPEPLPGLRVIPAWLGGGCLWVLIIWTKVPFFDWNNIESWPCFSCQRVDKGPAVAHKSRTGRFVSTQCSLFHGTCCWLSLTAAHGWCVSPPDTARLSVCEEKSRKSRVPVGTIHPWLFIRRLPSFLLFAVFLLGSQVYFYSLTVCRFFLFFFFSLIF